jgi:4-amino-4-deoxy-L-arabinose transferase-like glycosyltransferase
LFFGEGYFSICPLQSATRKFAFFVVCVLFHTAGTWIIPLIDRDEPRFAEASREMIERQDYIIPYFNNEYRFDKPPLTYWAQVASYRIFGQNDFAARFPAAVAAGLTALVLLTWGARVGGERVGWWAAIIFSLSLQVVVHAKAAVADMWMVLFVTLGHWAGYQLLRDKLNAESKRRTPNAERPISKAEIVEAAVPSRGIWWWIFYLALAFAFLAKGPIGWAPILTVTITILVLRDRTLFSRFKFLRGMLLTLIIVSLWGIPALIRSHGEFFNIGIGRHVVGRSVSAMGGHGAHSFGMYLLVLPFYFVTIFLSFFPWSWKLPWLAKRLRQRRDSLDLYLLSGVTIIFGIFTLVTTKLLHYTLPALPLLSLLLARRLDEENSVGFVKHATMMMATACLILTLLVSPFFAPFFPSRELFRKSRDDLKPEMDFTAVGYNEPSLVWYFRSRIHGWLIDWASHPTRVQSFMEQRGPRFVVLPTDLAQKLYPTLPANWKIFSTRGFNAVKGKRSDLTLILKPE